LPAPDKSVSAKLAENRLFKLLYFPAIQVSRENKSAVAFSKEPTGREFLLPSFPFPSKRIHFLEKF
jgi:hypothetical protein